MEKKDQKTDLHVKDNPLLDLLFKKHYLITYRLFIIIIGTTAILGGIGYLLDKELGTKPIFSIIGLVLALPVSIILIIKATKNLVKNTLNGKHS